MEKITKLHPVFLTFEGWVSTEGDVTVPENTMGGCPKCWSPVVREELSNNGVCVCCGWNDNLNKVIHSVELMSYQIQYNSSKHLPGGALPFLEYWTSRRTAHIATIKSNWILAHARGEHEVPGWMYQLETLSTGSTEARKAMLQQMGILDGDGKLPIGFDGLSSCLEAGGLQASKALYQYPEPNNTSDRPAELNGEKPSNVGEGK